MSGHPVDTLIAFYRGQTNDVHWEKVSENLNGYTLVVKESGDEPDAYTTTVTSQGGHLHLEHRY